MVSIYVCACVLYADDLSLSLSLSHSLDIQKELHYMIRNARKCKSYYLNHSQEVHEKKQKKRSDKKQKTNEDEIKETE